PLLQDAQQRHKKSEDSMTQSCEWQPLVKEHIHLVSDVHTHQRHKQDENVKH
ncbi:hypothetical protein LEMLEM_LOCUS3441, partial [Lemmus lemmus]